MATSEQTFDVAVASSDCTVPPCLPPLRRRLPALMLALGSMMGAVAPAKADISSFTVYHSNSYTQDASGLSAADASVQAIIVSNVKGEFDGGTATAPDGSVYAVINQSSAGYPFDQFGAYFGPQTFGSFTASLGNSVTLSTASASLSYTSDHYPDIAPQVANYAALQHFDPTLDNSIVLTSGFAVPGDATSASTTFFIYDEQTNDRLLQYSLDPGATVFVVPANTASPGEAIGYYFESDINYAVTVNGVVDTNIYRRITTGEINAALPVPEPSSWVMMLAGFAALTAQGACRRRRQAAAAVSPRATI
jgi:hypothetical protein